MPELPEVETTRRRIEPLLLGQRISALRHDSAKYLATDEARGRTIGAVSRRGKYLLLRLDAPKTLPLELILHLGMTGHFRLEPTPHTRLVIELEGAPALYFHDPRRFGKVVVVRQGDYALFPTLRHMGPEPLSDDFDQSEFVWRASQAGAVKPWLLSQKPVAGLGNIYVDEALWLTRLHPQQTRLNADEARKLHGAIREVLSQAVARGGSSLGSGVGNYRQHDGTQGGYTAEHHVYGKAGQLCGRCATPIVRTVVAQRGTHLCPECQVLRVNEVQSI